MRTGATMVAVLAAAALAFATAGCGGGSSSSATGVSTVIHVPPRPPRTPEEKAAAAAPRDKGGKAKPGAPKVAAGAICPGRVGAFVGSLEGLRRELEIGLSYEAYAGEIDAIRRLYDRIPVERLSLACLSAAGTPSERAFDRYVDAANTWNACAAEPSCGTARIEAPLQKEWRVAAHLLKEAKKGLQ